MIKNILKNLAIVFTVFSLCACGMQTDSTAADVSPSATVQESSPSYLEEEVLSEAEETASEEPDPAPVPNQAPEFVEPEPSDDAAAGSNIYSEYIDNWYAEVSGSGNTEDGGSESSIYAAYIDAWYREQREAENAAAESGDVTNTAITSDSIIPSGIGYLVTAYDFTTSMKTGSSVVTENNQPSSFPYEGRYGIDAFVSGTTLYVKAYSNMGYNPDIESAIIKTPDGRTVSVSGIDYDSYTQINLSGYNKTCRLVTTFDYNGFLVENKLNVYVNVDEAWLCKLTSMTITEFESRRNTVSTITTDLNITPDNSLSIDDVMYPVTDGNGLRRDTDRWAELSETIITDDSWSDEYKVVLIHDWIVSNIAYDNYRCDTLHASRDSYYKDWSGTYSVYNTRTGVCCDVNHIFLIMCRHNGIPCITLENDTHVWNGVWLDGKWQEMDLCDDIHRFTNTADTSVVNTVSAPGYGSLDNTGVPRLKYVNRYLWTYDCVWGSGGNYGWYYN